MPSNQEDKTATVPDISFDGEGCHYVIQGKGHELGEAIGLFVHSA
jgi:hypothetical protein